MATYIRDAEDGKCLTPLCIDKATALKALKQRVPSVTVDRLNRMVKASRASTTPHKRRRKTPLTRCEGCECDTITFNGACACCDKPKKRKV